MKKIFFTALLFLLLLVLWEGSNIDIQNGSVTGPQGIKASVDRFLHQGSRGANELYLIQGEILPHFYSASKFYLRYDDCLYSLKVEGKELLSERPLCQGWKGFVVDLADFPANKKLSLTIELHNVSGPYTLNFHPYWAQPFSFCLLLLLALSALCLAYLILRYLGFSRSITALQLGGLLLNFFYLLHTEYFIRGHDASAMNGHLKYIHEVAQGIFPTLKDCRVAYHPPLYYLLAAGIYRLAEWAQWDALFYLQCFSMVIFGGIIALVAKILTHSLPENRASLALALFISWPTTVFSSVRLGNDVLFYLGYLFTFYALLGWNKNHSPWAVAGGLFITLASKLSGMMLVPLILGGFLQEYWGAKKIFSWKKQYPIALALLAGLSINFSRDLGPLAAQTVNRFENQLVGNSWQNYLTFNPGAFIAHPFLTLELPERENFWFYLLKSALFDEWNFPGEWTGPVGAFLSLLLLLLIPWALAKMWRRRKKIPCWHFLNLLFPLLFLLAFRYSHPAYCYNNFRFVYPLMVSLFLGWALPHNRMEEKTISIITLVMISANLIFLGLILH
jgi:hypothetical protein